jgi:hypothetical protein
MSTINDSHLNKKGDMKLNYRIATFSLVLFMAISYVCYSDVLSEPEQFGCNHLGDSGCTMQGDDCCLTEIAETRNRAGTILVDHFNLETVLDSVSRFFFQRFDLAMVKKDEYNY